MSEVKPREWCLFYSGLTGQGHIRYAKQSQDGEGDVYYDVIEKSTFDQVVKERDELKRLWQSVADRVIPGEQDTVETVLAMLRERGELRAELKKEFDENFRMSAEIEWRRKEMELLETRIAKLEKKP